MANKGHGCAVVFATSVFGKVQTGPAIYAQYLWQAFRDDPEIEFHLVAPAVEDSHPRLHAAGTGPGGSVGLYRAICRKALEVAGPCGPRAIIHCNAAHSAGGIVGYAGPWIVQVNDYEAATCWRQVLGTLRRSGPRRVASLAWRRWQEQRVLAAASRAVCNSEFTRQAVLRAYRSDPRRTVAIHKAVDLAAFVRPRELPPDPLPQRPPGGRLLLVGTNWAVKGLDVLLKALALLASRRPGVSLTVAGPADLPANAALVRECGAGPLAEGVHFVGRAGRAELGPLLWHSDVFVLPSRQEGLGVAILEAMAAGVPVVASSVGGIPEIIRCDDEGLLVPPGDAEALAGAIEKLLADEGLRRRLAAAGTARAGSFSVAAMVGKVKSLYLELAGGVNGE